MTLHNLPYLTRAFDDGHAEFIGAGQHERIRYIAINHSERWSDPEEKVRAELWAELIYRHEYSPERIGIEAVIPDRMPNLFADLIIYQDDQMKQPYFVFECKPSDLSDAAFGQAIEQACGYRASVGAKFCGVVAGRTRRLLRFDRFPSGERDKNHIADIPVRYGRPPEWRFHKGKDQDLSAVSREELRAAIRKCHQTLWEGGRRTPMAAFGEFSKLVFIKYRDEKNPLLKHGEPYQFQRRDEETSEDLYARICQLYKAEQEREPNVFSESINIDPPILAQCVEHLEGISLKETELDTKGVAFEEFMGSFFKGEFGQYFTPRELVAFAVEALDPQRDDLILDPACGSGGFLLYALDHVRRAAGQYHEPGTIEHFQFWHDFAQNNLFGVEVNEELARVAKMNMIIHDDGHTNIVGHDALDLLKKIRDKNQGIAEGKFDIILTNPPFGASLKQTEKGIDYMDQFELTRYVGKKTSDGNGTWRKKPSKSIKSEIVFLERIHAFLKPGTGRAAVVLPDGILTNETLQGVRYWLLNHFELLAVVSLPIFAFSHYDAAVKASIVFLRRLADEESVPDDSPIFMAIAENIGYDASGRKTFEPPIVEKEVPGDKKIERVSCDLFDYRVHYMWSTASINESGWSERYREILPNTGLVKQWQSFRRDPTPFFL